jgi:hypothetical protein
MFKKLIKYSIITFIVIQLIWLDHTNPLINKDKELHTSKNIMTILKKSCYDCHSNETVWPVTSYVAPLSFVIVYHVVNGRKALNFSSWEDIDPKVKIDRLERAIQTVKNEMMAIPSYVSIHKSAKLNKNEKDILVEFFNQELSKLQ